MLLLTNETIFIPKTLFFRKFAVFRYNYVKESEHAVIVPLSVYHCSNFLYLYFALFQS